MYQILISRTAEKQMEGMQKHVANAIVLKIENLRTDPRPPGCKKLEGCENEYRIRSGDYRVIYRIEDQQLFVEVIRVAHRGAAYKKK